ncbi:hypothetical protein GW17_00036722 [Ensete ventricosum]|nr:hypothetical protein GW17_00036722 [Ensete ventricosum]
MCADGQLQGGRCSSDSRKGCSKEGKLLAIDGGRRIRLRLWPTAAARKRCSQTHNENNAVRLLAVVLPHLVTSKRTVSQWQVMLRSIVLLTPAMAATGASEVGREDCQTSDVDAGIELDQNLQILE